VRVGSGADDPRFLSLSGVAPTPASRFMIHRTTLIALLFACSSSFAACAAPEAARLDDAPREDVDQLEDPLAKSSTSHWFYDGPLPMLESARVTVALEGHTARVSGLVPAGITLSTLPPHVRVTDDGGRTRLDAVYPIATARAGKSDARPGNYRFGNVMPYRPDGIAVTSQEGSHMVTWGGFPFLRYNSGIALHGPITATDNAGSPDMATWYLQRGDVSGGCNRMMGEHVVELAHLSGISMRKVYAKNAQVSPAGAARVTVITGYDSFGGNYVDVDYPTDAHVSPSTVTRPAKVYGADRVTMFGSWVASEAPFDLPTSFQWEAGISGRPYVFANHVQKDWVCSVAPAHLARLSSFITRNQGLPAGFCQKKACVLDALAASADPKARCGF
jgi:hypothetical protein